MASYTQRQHASTADVISVALVPALISRYQWRKQVLPDAQGHYGRYRPASHPKTIRADVPIVWAG